MSDMNLKVTPAELEAKAADFKSVMTQTKSLTDDMMNDDLAFYSHYDSISFLLVIIT